MPRPTCRRRIGFIPNVVYFKPAGIPIATLDEVIIGHDELEALRLKNLMGLPQEEAANIMGISQPTLHRLLSNTYQKIADALINGKAIRVEGGNVELITCGMKKGWRCNINQNIKEEFKEKGDQMKIAITSVDGTMEGPIDERFGRARKIIIYDKETKNWSVLDNTVNMASPQGAGIQTAQNVIKAGAGIVISGHLGPKAFQVLNAAGVHIYTATNKSAKDAIVAFEERKLNRLTGPDVGGHW